MGAMSELHIKMQDEMMNAIHRAKEGEITTLDALIYLEKERKNLENSLAIVKSFKDEHLENISNEASDYKDGYKGFMIEVRNGGRTFKYNHIKEWQQAEASKKAIEEKSKQAFISKEKGLLTATEDGEEIELPEITYRKSSVILKEKR